MQLHQANITIGQSHMGNPLALPPSPTSVPSSQPAHLTNRFPNGECLDICNVADDREVYSAIVPELRRAVNLPSNGLELSGAADLHRT